MVASVPYSFSLKQRRSGQYNATARVRIAPVAEEAHVGVVDAVLVGGLEEGGVHSAPLGPGGRPRRRVRLPKRDRDEPPALPTIVEPPVVPVIDPLSTPTSCWPNTEEEPQKWVKTEPNIPGLYKIFPNSPTHDPDESVSLDDLCKISELLVAPKISSFSPATPLWFPFLNSTVARLMV
ncbi:hypothetical protein B0H19DRAFT_1257699 [Mycena capillaripes]|nr:hypothetical protein B0H19DRAFT_1257699 [Mycena capillaripes]